MLRLFCSFLNKKKYFFFLQKRNARWNNLQWKFFLKVLRVEGGNSGDEVFGVAVRPSAPLRLYGNNEEDLHLTVAYVSSLLAHFLASRWGGGRVFIVLQILSWFHRYMWKRCKSNASHCAPVWSPPGAGGLERSPNLLIQNFMIWPERGKKKKKRWKKPLVILNVRKEMKKWKTSSFFFFATQKKKKKKKKRLSNFRWSLWNPTMSPSSMNTFLSSAGTNMPVIRTLSKVAKQALLGTPGCGCQPLTVAVRNISFSPRQVTSDASFHSVSFSETDHPKVLITGMCQQHFRHTFFFFFFLSCMTFEMRNVMRSCAWEHNVLCWDSTPAGFLTSLQWRQKEMTVENKRVGGERLDSSFKHALLLSYFSLYGNQQWWLWAAAHL